MPYNFLNLILRKIRNNKNNRDIFYNFLGALTVKGGALIVSFLTIPAYFRYFKNNEVLGVWFTILSIVSWILNFDLGIGNGLRNHLVKAIEKNDKNEIRSLISSSYFITAPVVLILISLSLFFFKKIEWNTLLNISTNLVSKETLATAATITFSGIMVQFLLKMINSILYSLQKSAINNLLVLITNIIILIYITLFKSPEVSANLINLSIAYALAVNTPLLIISFIVFKYILKDCRPKISCFNADNAKKVLILGGKFLWVQIMYMIITTTNEFLISLFTTPEKVVEYQLYNKIFTLSGILFSLALTPIWSAVTKAFVQNNLSWIKKLYKLLSLTALLFIALEFLIIPFLQMFFNIWLKENSITVNYSYALIFALFGSMIIWNGVISSIVNGFGKLKIQTIFLSFGAIIKIPVAYLIVLFLNSWIGVVISNIIALSLYCIIQPLWIVKLLNKTNNGEKNA